MDGTPDPGPSPVGLRPPLAERQIGAAKANHRVNKGAEWNEAPAVGSQVVGNAEPKTGPVAVPAERDVPTKKISKAFARGVPAQASPGVQAKEGSRRGF
jgi:hypothetical protein